MKKKQWNRCDYCGKFISFSDLDSGKASRKLVTPDSYLSKEEYETVCSKCNAKEMAH